MQDTRYRIQGKKTTIMHHESCIPHRGSCGITLIELIVVIAVIGILVVALGFEFRDWIRNYKVESQIKEMYIDLMNAKARAMQRNRAHFVNLTATQYAIREDVDPWPDGDGVQTANDDVRPPGYADPIPLLQKNLNPNEPITWRSPSDPQPQILFNKRGLSNVTSPNYYICSNTDVDTDYNCIEISASRIGLGKLTTKIPDGGACNAPNCIVK